MNERPILFSAPMVRAILDGRKTMTRRVMRPQPEDYPYHYGLAVYRVEKRCTYGVPGDLLWVRETWATTEQAGVHPSDAQIVYRATDPDWDTMEGWRWRPSIFMPRWASRLKLRITSVRVERVQEITEEDARAEGAPRSHQGDRPHFSRHPVPNDTHRLGFVHIWDSINAGRGFGWDTNPWVWVIGFEVVQ
jgi:hypothetical protein